MKAEDIVKKLKLEPLEPEGGYFRRTYESEEFVQGAQGGERHLLTTIYYLLTKSNFSSFHRLPHVEIFHFYTGARVQFSFISPAGEWENVVMGPNVLSGEVPQLIVPPNVWQAAQILPAESGDWALLGTTVSPGFDFADFELGKRDGLCREFPSYSEEIRKLTRG